MADEPLSAKKTRSSPLGVTDTSFSASSIAAGCVNQYGVFQRMELIRKRGVDVRVAVPEQVDPPGTDGIQITVAFEVFQPYAFATANRDHR
jgi:hypothetical protein